MPTDNFSAMPLTEALKALPNVKTKVARQLIAEWDEQSLCYANGHLRPQLQVLSDTISLSRKELCEFSNEDYDLWGKKTVSPVGAQHLIKLYEAGLLPMDGPIEPVSIALVSYAQRNEYFSDLKAKRQAFAEEQRNAQSALMTKPLDSFKEEDFSFSLLNALFWKHDLKGDAQLMVGGLLIQKSVIRHKSNSGKSQDYEVTFSWKSSQGETVQLRRESQYANNRRNDEERNWGLPG
jgi:hypothetical protein